MKEWLEWKYRKRQKATPVKYPDDLVFSKAKFGKDETQTKQANPVRVYQKIVMEFNTLLKTVGMDERKEGMKRRKVTLHSFRRFAKTVVSTQASQDYSEWFLGHAKSSYWTMKEPQRREIYATKCMKYLTFLDYSDLEAAGKSVEAKLDAKDKEIAFLQERYNESVRSVSLLSDQFVMQSERLGKLEKIMQARRRRKKDRDIEKRLD